jgi:hypothetical protein
MYSHHLLKEYCSAELVNLLGHWPGNPEDLYWFWNLDCKRLTLKDHNIYAQMYVSWGSSVSIMTDCGLYIQVLIHGKGKGFFSSTCIQTGSWSLPACYRVGTGGPFPGGKVWPGHESDHLLPSGAEVKNIRSCTSSALSKHLRGQVFFLQTHNVHRKNSGYSELFNYLEGRSSMDNYNQLIIQKSGNAYYPSCI